MKPTPEQLAELKARVRDCMEEAQRARKAYHAALCQAHPFQVGDIIRSTSGREAKVVEVAIFRTHWDHIDVKPECLAVMRKKDGKFGIHTASMWREEWVKAVVVGHEE